MVLYNDCVSNFYVLLPSGLVEGCVSFLLNSFVQGQCLLNLHIGWCVYLRKVMMIPRPQHDVSRCHVGGCMWRCPVASEEVIERLGIVPVVVVGALHCFPEGFHEAFNGLPGYSGDAMGMLTRV